MKLQALRLDQFGTVLYLTQMTAKELLSCSYTDEWNPDLKWDIEKQGFQRAPVEKHFKAIGRFLADSSNPFLPTAALLSAAEDRLGILPYEPLSASNENVGTLTVSASRQMVILDYQHRYRGLKYAIEELGASHLAEFSMPVVIVPNIPRFEEIRQFYLINSKQRRIDTDLALALMQTLVGHVEDKELVNLVGPGKRYRIRATRLTFKLAARSRGPWVGRIAQPHDLPQPLAVIRLKSFVDSLRNVLSKNWDCSLLDDDELLDVLSAYWSAVRTLVPEAFKKPQNFQIQKTVGVFALHILFARRVYPNCKKARSLTKSGFQKELQPLASRYLSEKFWRTGGPASLYVGGSGFLELARLMMGKVPIRRP